MFVVQSCARCGRPPSEGEGWEPGHRGYDRIHTVCPERVCKEFVLERGTLSASGHPCSRNAKGQNDKGKWMCGIHLRAYNNHKATINKVVVEMDINKANRDRGELAASILAELGVEVSPHYSSIYHKYTGDVVIDPAELLRVLGIGYKLPDKQ